MKQEITYQIQLAEAKHVPLITDLYVRSWKRAYKGLLNQPYLDSLSYEDKFKKWSEYITKPGQGAFVAMDGEKMLGFVSFMPYHPYYPIDNCFYLDSLHVEPECHGQGIGTALIERVLEEGRKGGYPQMGICVVRGNENALNLYLKMGAEHLAVREETFTGELSYADLLLWKL